MSYQKNQSFIKESADQVFVDTADGYRLDIVGANVSVQRPFLAFQDDDKFRAAIKKLAFNSKNIRTAFKTVLELCYGPRNSRRSDLSISAYKNDKYITVNDASVFTGVGTLILDKGLINEETVNFVFIDKSANRIYLKTALIYNHMKRLSGVENTYGITSASTAIPCLGSFSVNPIDSKLPYTSYPYPVLVRTGDTEVFKLVSSNAGNTATATAAFTADAAAYTSTGIVLKITNIDPYTGFIKVVGSTSQLGPSGWLLVTWKDLGSVAEQIVYFYENDTVNNVLKILNCTVQPTAFDGYVEKIELATSIETCSVLQQGSFWDIFGVETGKLFIYVPSLLEQHELRDASYLHGYPDVTISTTLNADLNVDDTTLSVVSTSGFPEAPGILLLNGSAYVTYSNIVDANTFKLSLPSKVLVGSGSTAAYYTEFYTSTTLVEGNMRGTNPPASVLPNRYAGHYVYSPFSDVVPTSVATTLNTTASRLVLPGPTNLTNNGKVGYTCLEVDYCHGWEQSPSNQHVDINRGYANYESTKVSKRFYKEIAVTGVSGSYLAGVTTINGIDTSNFPSAGNFAVIFSRGEANQETCLVTSNVANVLTISGATTKAHSTYDRVEILNAPISNYTADGILKTMTFLNTSVIPVGTKLGYRVMVGTELLTVESNVANILTFTNPFVDDHTTSDELTLISDVLQFTTGLAYDHTGGDISTVGDTVQPIVNSVELTSSTDFDSSGTCVFNYGYEYPETLKILGVINTTTFTITDLTPVPPAYSGYGFITVNYGTAGEETILIDATALPDEVGLTYPPRVPLVLGDTVRFRVGKEESFTYNTKSTNTLVITNGHRFSYPHTLGEKVYKATTSQPSVNGDTFQVVTPADPGSVIKDFVEYVRTAGIEVTIANKR